MEVSQVVCVGGRSYHGFGECMSDGFFRNIGKCTSAPNLEGHKRYFPTM